MGIANMNGIFMTRSHSTSFFLPSVLGLVVAAIIGVRVQCFISPKHGRKKSLWTLVMGKDNNSQNDDAKDDSLQLGSRGKSALSPVLPYFEAFYKCLQDPCHEINNPQGHIALCVAENKLVHDKLAERCHKSSSSYDLWKREESYCYNDMRGLPDVRSSFAVLLEHYFWSNKAQNEFINPEHITLSSGASSILNQLFYTLAEPGDAVLIPAPYYAAFENDMKAIAKCVPIPVYSKDPAKGPTPSDLDIALIDCRQKRLNVKVLLLTNPNNPLGVIYTAEVIANAIAWSRRHKLHTIVDEIYALSAQEPGSFKSVIEILENKLDSDVHFIWALSKDFGSSGFRFGLLYSQNEALSKALANINMFSSISHPMQLLIKDVIEDYEFMDEFLDFSRKALAANLETCTKTLDELHLPYVDTNAGIFVYVDFSSLLPINPTPDDEHRLAAIFETCARIVMTPGHAQRDRRPGHFRICYAWVSIQVLSIAMRRIKLVVSAIRGMGIKIFHEQSLGELTQSDKFVNVVHEAI